MLIISANDQKNLVNMNEVLHCVEVALKEFSASKTDTPIRTVLPFGTGNSGLVMPSVAEGLNTMGLKYVTVVPGNKDIGKKAIHGVVLLSDIKTGEPLALLEGSYLTLIRTGALSGVATKYLARPDAKSLGIIGTGEQAIGLCEAILAVRNIEVIYLFNRSVQKAYEFAEIVATRFQKEVVVCQDSNEVVRNSDILVTATTSMEPVFSEELKPGIHVNAVGSFRPTMQELPTNAICAATKVVVESKEAALEEAGDLHIPIVEGAFFPEQLHAELGQIVSGERSGREDDQEITIFKSVGLAIADIVVAQYLYEQAIKSKKGIIVDL
ncbi:ornithine cyclodeaminase family protein [Sporosarcina sp. JAI121]|uniref:ornithine cyclodeaminase family protein n=1 Tax=Sporosarcina sp. JAI121 TaxID=2723064 RepID=UPI0015C78B95|nr:ornithine cyclodeaminase family protein [Sporosarcina sp. JAI121]NYF23776.1 ornithine cyclodeaminase [Sporosarcina sp. JAI121]